MDGFPPVYILLTTYKRTETALRTIRNIKEKLIYPNYGWYVNDDGSDQDHVNAIMEEIGVDYHRYFHNSNRQGVGRGMNTCLMDLWAKGVELFIAMEDDWELIQPLDLTPYVKLLMDHEEYGMVRFGYMAANLLLYTISEEGKILYRVEPNEETYRFTGHPSLRHKRFHEHYGYYDEGLTPGMTELSMAGKTNAKSPGPYIVLSGDYNCYGAFAHIGTEALGDVEPVK
jgi:glycosyl transferase family 2